MRAERPAVGTPRDLSKAKNSRLLLSRFALLQIEQHVTTLLASLVPPLAHGTTWSRVQQVAVVVPQYTQRQLSRR